MISFEPIGVVRSDFDRPDTPHEMRSRESRIVVDAAYEEGLYRIEQNDHVTVLFHIHESGDYTLTGPRLYGEERGTFACRSPNRPNPIGMTTVELLGREGNELRVTGLDAIDGTPVLDIKPFAPSLDCPDTAEEASREAPRAGVESYVRNRDLQPLLLAAGALHGHFCPFLALGVMAGVDGLRELGVATRDPEPVVAVVEGTGCFSDGVESVTGCTLGNGRLVVREVGKRAVALAREAAPEEGVRIHAHGRAEVLGDYPDARTAFDRVVVRGDGTADERVRFAARWTDVAFDLLGRPLREFCDIETDAAVDVPNPRLDYEEVTCASCGEWLEAAHAVEHDGDAVCRPCADEPFYEHDRAGVRRVDDR